MAQITFALDDNLTVLWLEIGAAATPLPRAHVALGHDVAVQLLTRSAARHVVCEGGHIILSGFLHPIPALHSAWRVRELVRCVGLPIRIGIHYGAIKCSPHPLLPGRRTLAGEGVQGAKQMARLAQVPEILVTPALYAHPAMTPDEFVFIQQQRWVYETHESEASGLSCYVLALHGALLGAHLTEPLVPSIPQDHGLHPTHEERNHVHKASRPWG